MRGQPGDTTATEVGEIVDDDEGGERGEGGRRRNRERLKQNKKQSAAFTHLGRLVRIQNHVVF